VIGKVDIFEQLCLGRCVIADSSGGMSAGCSVDQAVCCSEQWMPA